MSADTVQAALARVRLLAGVPDTARGGTGADQLFGTRATTSSSTTTC